MSATSFTKNLQTQQSVAALKPVPRAKQKSLPQPATKAKSVARAKAASLLQSKNTPEFKDRSKNTSRPHLAAALKRAIPPILTVSPESDFRSEISPFSQPATASEPAAFSTSRTGLKPEPHLKMTPLSQSATTSEPASRFTSTVLSKPEAQAQPFVHKPAAQEPERLSSSASEDSKDSLSSIRVSDSPLCPNVRFVCTYNGHFCKEKKTLFCNYCPVQHIA